MATLFALVLVGCFILAPWKTFKLILSYFIWVVPSVLAGLYFSFLFCLELYFDQPHWMISAAIAMACWTLVGLWLRWMFRTTS